MVTNSRIQIKVNENMGPFPHNAFDFSSIYYMHF